MAETQIYYIGTSKVKEIRKSGSVTYDWNIPKKLRWQTFKAPVAASKKKVKYSKTLKDKAGTRSKAKREVPSGGETKLGTYFSHSEERMIAGVSRQCEVAYFVRGYTKYKRTAALKRSKKMAIIKYTVNAPYQYAKIYKDKPIVQKEYSTYEDGIEYIYFGDHYYKNGQRVNTQGHLPHPTEYELQYFDVRKNFKIESNNSDRDNSGTYVLSNVRANVVNITMKWEGLNAAQGMEILDTLNPEKNSSGQYDYLIVQYLDYAKNTVKTGTFFASERNVKKYATGDIESITVTLTEV